MAKKKKPSAETLHVLERWLTGTSANVGAHELYVLVEAAGARVAVMDELRALLHGHYVAPEITAKRVASLGAKQTAALLKEHLPRSKTARSGDVGEIVATEVAEQALGYSVPIRRLRAKDGREMALRGDDVIGVAHGAKGALRILKGESKSRSVLSKGVLDEAGEALDRDAGRPTRHTVLFIAARLRESGRDDLAEALEQAVLKSFSGTEVSHLLFVLTGTDPTALLTQHLNSAGTKKRRRHAIGVAIPDHETFIAKLFEAK